MYDTHNFGTVDGYEQGDSIIVSVNVLDCICYVSLCYIKLLIVEFSLFCHQSLQKQTI